MVRKDEGTPSEFSTPEYVADAFGACAMKVSSAPQPINSRQNRCQVTLSKPIPTQYSLLMSAALLLHLTEPTNHKQTDIVNVM